MKDDIFPLQVWIEDTDYGGVVYHANYLKYFERARSAWVDALGMGLLAQQAAGILFAVRKAALEYCRPARLNDRLEVVSRVTRMGRASLDFSQYLRRPEAPETVLCLADTRIACVTPSIRSCALPDDWRNKFEVKPAFSVSGGESRS